MLLINFIKNDVSILDEKKKINIIKIINNKYIIINEVINSNIQIYSCFSEICKFNNSN